MNEILLKDRQGPVLTLTLNDPARANPLSSAMASELYRALSAAADDPSGRAVVLRGAGRHFSAGADLHALQRVAEAGDPAANLADSRQLEELFALLLDHPKLTLAAVAGAAVAGGCGLATACDLVVAERSSRFSYTEVKIGFIPALVSTFLTRRVTGQVARRLLLDPEMIDGEQAVALGLADRVVDDGTAYEQACQWALDVCAKASPSALAATKLLLNRVVGMGWREALSEAAEANAAQRSHAECRHGVRSFLETKSTPDWLKNQ